MKAIDNAQDDNLRPAKKPRKEPKIPAVKSNIQIAKVTAERAHAAWSENLETLMENKDTGAGNKYTRTHMTLL